MGWRILDVNNIIEVPETPKWRPRFSFQQNQLLQDGLLDAILTTIASTGLVKKPFLKNIRTSSFDHGNLTQETINKAQKSCF